MVNSTNIKVPKKYHYMIDEIYELDDSYWIATKKGFYISDFDLECHEVGEDTKQETLQHIRNIKPCNCRHCKEV